MRQRRVGVFFAALVIGLGWMAPPAHANILHGLGNIIGGVLQIPIQILAGTFSGPPVIGTIGGALSGAVQGVGMVLGGTLELAGDGFELAKAAAPYVLPFLF